MEVEGTNDGVDYEVIVPEEEEQLLCALDGDNPILSETKKHF